MCPSKYIPTLLLAFILMGSVRAQNATEIISKMDEKARGSSSTAEMTMTIIRPTWERSISMKTWSKGSDYAMVLVTAPAREKGQTTLKRGNEIWNWVPNIGRTVKLPPSMMMQSWMGSDFTNDDLVRESSIVHDYTHELAGDSTINQYESWKIELTPKPEAPVVWGKIIMWVAKEELVQLRTEFYDEDGYLINVMKSYDLKEFDDRILPSRMEMIPVEDEGNKTVLEYKSMSFNENIRDNFFSVQNMKRLN